MERKRKSLSFFSTLTCRATSATKSNIVEGMCGRTLTAKSWPVGAAIIRGTEPRATSRDARSSRLRSNGVMCNLLCAVGVRRIPICCPLPDVADHIIKIKRVSSKRAGWSRVKESIRQFICLRPMALPDVGTAIFCRIPPARVFTVV